MLHQLSITNFRIHFLQILRGFGTSTQVFPSTGTSKFGAGGTSRRLEDGLSCTVSSKLPFTNLILRGRNSQTPFRKSRMVQRTRKDFSCRMLLECHGVSDSSSFSQHICSWTTNKLQKHSPFFWSECRSSSWHGRSTIL